MIPIVKNEHFCLKRWQLIVATFVCELKLEARSVYFVLKLRQFTTGSWLVILKFINLWFTLVILALQNLKLVATSKHPGDDYDYVHKRSSILPRIQSLVFEGVNELKLIKTKQKFNFISQNRQLYTSSETIISKWPKQK